jgi:carboxylate-amine ligase
VRYGIDGQLIDFGKREQLPTRELIEELLEFVGRGRRHLQVAARARSRARHLREGSSADRQLRVFAWRSRQGGDRARRKFESAAPFW